MTDKLDIKTMGLVLIPILFFLRFAYVPWSEWIETERLELQTQKELLSRQEALEGNADIIEQLANTSEQKLADLTKGLEESSAGTVSLKWLDLVDNSVSQNNVTLQTKTPDRAIQITDTISGFSGTVAVRGDASNVLTFLKQLETTTGTILREVDMRKNRRARDNELFLQVQIITLFRIS